jgi:Ca-activated chloride channel homolog
VASNTNVADKRMGELAKQTSGAGGFFQRDMKAQMQQANNAPLAGKPAMAASAAPPADANFSFSKSLEHETLSVSQSVRNVGNRTFFRRNNQWIDSQVGKGQADNALHVKQFSDEYFKLAEKHGRQLTQYLVFDEPVLVNVENQAYLVEP